MKKKYLFYLLPLLGLTLTGCGKDEEPPKPDDPGTVDPSGDPSAPEGDTTVYDAVVDDKVGIVEKEAGYLHQLTYEGQVIDIVGYEESGGKVGSIKRATYNGHTYNGMIYNRSLITNLDMIRVDFSGGDLQYIFSDFLMEDMDFESKTGNTLVSGQPFTVPAGKGYFVLYTKSTTPVNIDGVMLKFKETGFDAKMIYNKDTTRGGARSLGVAKIISDSFIELENNPTEHTNNYSRGKHISADHPDSWYRWNGQYFVDSAQLGTDFTFGLTIAGEYSRFSDESKFFHYNVWPQFSYGNSSDEPWVQTYIGNDNYEPLGKDNALLPDADTNYSYTGRFYGSYDWYDPSTWEVDYDNAGLSWKFGDPDYAKIPDGSKTLREAYNETKLPFWFLKFHVYLDEDSDAKIDIYINGTMIYSDWIFYNYDTANKPSIYMHTFPMHLINYGIDAEGTPGDKYTATFTYPRLIER